MQATDPRLNALARSARRGEDPTAEVGAVLVGLVISGSTALWAMVQLGLVPLTGVLIASSVMVGACGLEVVRRLFGRRTPRCDDPIETLVAARRAAVQDELERWTRPTAWLIAGVGSFLVICAGIVVLPMLSAVPAALGGLFLGSILVASTTYLLWGLAVRVPRLRRDLWAMDEATTA